MKYEFKQIVETMKVAELHRREDTTYWKTKRKKGDQSDSWVKA